MLLRCHCEHIRSAQCKLREPISPFQIAQPALSAAEGVTSFPHNDTFFNAFVSVRPTNLRRRTIVYTLWACGLNGIRPKRQRIYALTGSVSVARGYSMKKVVAEKYRDIDFSRAKRGAAVKPEPGKTTNS